MLIGVANVVSKRIKKILVSNEGIVQTIYNPIELEKYHRKNVNVGSFTYIHIGRLTPIKNQTMLLDAFSLVERVLPNSRLLIVGDGGLRDILEQHAAQLAIDDKVQFLGNRSDIPDLLANSDAFVLSSDSEACPMTVLEAMASGVPVIATNVGAISEQLGSNKMLSPKRDSQRLFENMKTIQTSTRLREKVISNQLDRVKVFDASIIALQHEKLYRQLYSKVNQ